MQKEQDVEGRISTLGMECREESNMELGRR